jgi:hypothetical protein
MSIFSSSFCLLAHLQSQSQTQSMLSNQPDLQTRNRELTEIAKSISDLAELFKDLSVLVIDQGTLLDSVEYNIEQTAVRVSDAVNELNLATSSVVPIGMTCPVTEYVYAGIKKTLVDGNVFSCCSSSSLDLSWFSFSSQKNIHPHRR